MRTTIVAAILLFCGAALAVAQSPQITLENQESADFYYLVDPQALAGVTLGSANLTSKVASFFADRSDTPAFSKVASGAEAHITGLSDGTHLLVGFFAEPDMDQFPVKALALQADSKISDRYYALFEDPPLLKSPRGQGRLAAFARPGEAGGTVAATGGEGTAGGAAAGSGAAGGAAGGAAAGSGAAAFAPDLKTIATFPASFQPATFTRESAGSFTVLPISQSRFWGMNGTRISAVDSRYDAGMLSLAIEVPSGFSASVSYFLYIFSDRQAGATNRFTLELRPVTTVNKAACLLWQSGASAPSIVGTVGIRGDTVQLDLNQADLPSALRTALGPTTTADLTSCWYDKAHASYEEFAFATLTFGSGGSAGQ